MSELKTRIYLEKKAPDIILINEVKPKHSRYIVTEVELQINGYDIVSLNLSNQEGRGILIYVRSYLGAREVKSKTEFQESLWLEILMEKGDKLLLGCIYRSPSSGADNNRNLLNLLRELYEYNATHLLIAGDFNYPRINWDNWSTDSDVLGDEFLFIEALRDIHLYQHITSPTRARGSDTPQILDLVLTNEEGMVEEVEHKSPIGKSDHTVLKFHYKLYSERSSTRQKIFMYDKGEYEKGGYTGLEKNSCINQRSGK